jgi:hypothetical protein
VGETLDPIVIGALTDELQKIAKGPGFFGNVAELGRRLGSPKAGLQSGWKMLSPAGRLSSGTHHAKPIAEGVARTRAAKRALETRGRLTPHVDTQPVEGLFGRPAQYKGDTALGRVRAHLRAALGTGTHLEQPGKALGKTQGAREIAEELSRRGVTGEGAITKYLPLGDKSQMLAIGPAMAYPALASGQTGLAEETGATLGYTIPGILAAGTGVPGFVDTMGAGMLAGRVGRKLDEARNRRALEQAGAYR